MKKIKNLNKVAFGLLFAVCLFAINVHQAHAAYLNFGGFETGNTIEGNVASGTMSVQSVIKHSGTYALRINPTAAVARWQMQKPNASGNTSSLALSTGYYSVWFYAASLPGVTTKFFDIDQTASANCLVGLELTAGGVINLYYCNSTDVKTTIGSSTAISAGTWNQVEIKTVNLGTKGSSTVEFRLNGSVIATGVNLSVSSLASPLAEFARGGASSVTSWTGDFYYDDISISDSAYPGVNQVNILKPKATGTTSNWTNGAGTSPTNVAEIPHDSDTSYITSSTNAQVTTVYLDSADTGGVSSSLLAVKSLGVVRDTGGVSSFGIRLKSSATNSDTTAVDPGASYVPLYKVFNTDPNTSAAWTRTALDALEVGVVNSAAVAARATGLYVGVLSASVAPTVTTSAAGSVTATSAILNSTINPGGASTNITYRYGTSNVACASLGSTIAGPTGLTGSINLSAGTTQQSLSGLTPNQIYYFCATATNSVGTTNGSVLNFTTLSTTPTITSPTNTSITQTGATLGGNITSDGGAAISGRGVCVGTSANPAIGGTCFTTAGTTGIFTVTATSLTANTLYHYRAYATNSVGTSYTTDDTFTTLTSAPTTVSTTAQTSLYSYYATLNGSANPNGYTTTGHFRVFPNTSPGNCTSDTGGTLYPTSGSVAIGSDSTVHNFLYTIPFSTAFLTPNTTYYYCAYAVSANGTIGGSSVVSFFTPFGPASPCDAPLTGNLSLPAGAMCNLTGTTYDGVDAGSGTTNTANLALASGVQLTIGAGQTIGRGSVSNAGGTLTLAQGGILQKSGIYVHDADGDGVLDDSAKYIGTAPSAGYVRRTAFQTSATNSAALAYSTNIEAITLFDCNTGSVNVFQNIGNLVKDADNDGYKTAVAAGTQCVGATSVINGRTYYKDVAGAYTWMDAASALGGGATDCDDTTGAPCAPTSTSVVGASPTSTTVSWSAGTGPAATSYTVTCVSGGSCSNTSRGSQTSPYTDSSLTCGTSYTYNVTATNASGTSPASSNFSGSTNACVPTVTTTAASSITSTTVLLNSTINPNGASTSITYRYQTGATATCNGTTPASTIAGPTGLTGSSPLSGATTQQSLTGLSANTTYYFCATANNAVGTAYDVVLSFTTLKANGTTCTLASECNSGNCYVDADNDRYSPASGTKTCRASTQIAGTDCYDSNANAFPGQTLYFTTNRGDGSFDYDCVGGATYTRDPAVLSDPNAFVQGSAYAAGSDYWQLGNCQFISANRFNVGAAITSSTTCGSAIGDYPYTNGGASCGPLDTTHIIDYPVAALGCH